MENSHFLNLILNGNIELKYNISYTGPKSDNLKDFIIKDILFSTDIKHKSLIKYDYDTESYEGCCRYCGCGNDRHMILQFTNNTFGYLKYWNSCLTYLSNDTNHTLEIADSLPDVIQYCLTDPIRNIYFQYITDYNNIQNKLNEYLILDLTNIVSQYLYVYRFRNNYPVL